MSRGFAPPVQLQCLEPRAGRLAIGDTYLYFAYLEHTSHISSTAEFSAGAFDFRLYKLSATRHSRRECPQFIHFDFG